MKQRCEEMFLNPAFGPCIRTAHSAQPPVTAGHPNIGACGKFFIEGQYETVGSLLRNVTDGRIREAEPSDRLLLKCAIDLWKNIEAWDELQAS